MDLDYIVDCTTGITTVVDREGNVLEVILPPPKITGDTLGT